jgi:hypothetical protein
VYARSKLSRPSRRISRTPNSPASKHYRDWQSAGVSPIHTVSCRTYLGISTRSQHLIALHIAGRDCGSSGKTPGCHSQQNWGPSNRGCAAFGTTRSRLYCRTGSPLAWLSIWRRTGYMGRLCPFSPCHLANLAVNAAMKLNKYTLGHLIRNTIF